LPGRSVSVDDRFRAALCSVQSAIRRFRVSAGDPADALACDAGVASPRRITSAELFDGRRDIVIVHRGQEYRLHITKADKLILTK